MNYPKCGKELRPGWVDAPRVPFWSPDQNPHSPDLRKDIQLFGIEPMDFIHHRRLPAGICEDCRVLVSEY